MYNIVSIPIGLIDYIWPDVINFIESAINKAHGEITIVTVKERLKKDSALLVVAIEQEFIVGIAIFQKEVYDSGKTALILGLAAGNIDLFSGDYDDFMISLARNLNCDEIRAIGCRLGWSKKLKSLGSKWKELSTTLIYEV